jgi:hypothetical protein
MDGGGYRVAISAVTGLLVVAGTGCGSSPRQTSDPSTQRQTAAAGKARYEQAMVAIARHTEREQERIGLHSP